MVAAAGTKLISLAAFIDLTPEEVDASSGSTPTPSWLLIKPATRQTKVGLYAF